jgi:acetyl esterase/lipase
VAGVVAYCYLETVMKRKSAFNACLILFCILTVVVAQAPNPPFHLPDNVELKTDLVYCKGGGRDLKLDLFLPKEGSIRRPAVIFIHGGGWQSGNRRAFYRQAAHLASTLGYVGACIEYRLSGEAKFPAAVEDSKCAVRWLRANAKTYAVDPNRVAACGGSAGGHLAAMLGVTDQGADLEGSGGYSEFSSRVNLVIDFNGVSDLQSVVRSEPAAGPVGSFLGATFQENPALYRKASPIMYVDKNAPPFLLLHGTADTTVPIDQSRVMLKKLQEAGVRAEIYEADGGKHGFFNAPPFFEPALKRMEAFLIEHFGPKH